MTIVENTNGKRVVTMFVLRRVGETGSQISKYLAGGAEPGRERAFDRRGAPSVSWPANEIRPIAAAAMCRGPPRRLPSPNSCPGVGINIPCPHRYRKMAVMSFSTSNAVPAITRARSSRTDCS